MKQKLLQSLRLRLALIVALLCSLGTGTAWATDPINIASFSNGSQSGWTLYDGEWSGTSYYKLIKNTAYIETPSITWDDYTDITITITARKFGGPDATQGKISVRTSGGATDLTSYSPSNTSLVASSALSISPTGTGKLKIACLGASSSKGCGVSQIVIQGKLATTAEATTTEIDATGVNNNIFDDNTNGGTLTATVKDSSDDPIAAAAVTWSSSDETVAVINSTTGVITLKKVGSTTITASYAGVSDVYQSSSTTYVLNVINEDPDIEEIWTEDFSGFSKDAVPSGGTYSYACTNGGGTTKIWLENSAGGESPELLVAKNNGTFSATVTLLHPTYAYSGNLTLTFKSNANSINVKTTTDGITVDGEASEGAGVSFSTAGTHTVTFEGVTTATTSITIVFTATVSDKNVRLDDIVLKGKQAALSVVATPTISPASGTVVSGTEVTLTCLTDGASIYYTMGENPADPTSSSTLYDPISKPTITEATTIKAIGIKDGLTNSGVVSASYTIAAPCATPTFSVAAGEVTKGTTVTISCATVGATIYYTTNGDTPTTSSSVYSSAITINATQTLKAIAVKDGMANSAVASATYTVRDFVNLPFSFNLGSSSITSTVGLTQSGLGSDYSTDNTKLKFDGSGDNVILKFNSAPVVLTYSITGNGFSGGTFKVQTSADGSSYSDLKSYTSLGSSVINEAFYNIPTTARYIKWIYTTKSSGNVGLGNIKLVEAEPVTIGSAGYASYATTHKVSIPDGVTAYIATTSNGSSVTLSSVEKVPASTALVLKATAGSYKLPVITTTTDDVSGNKLHASDGSVAGDGSTIYALGNKSGVGFYLVGKDVTIPAGKVYLDLSDFSLPVKEFLSFDFGNATSVSEVKSEDANGDKLIYNLAGQRLQKLQRGINIVNGRKIMVK